MKEGKRCPRDWGAGKIRSDNKESFFSKVFPEPNTGCWIHTALPNDSGYSRVTAEYFNGFNTAHRFSYFLHHGEFNRKLSVLHTCDNRWCVNPQHLYLGTHDDNMRDMVARKRSNIGERNTKAKLTELDVRKIIKMHGDGYDRRELSKIFSIGKTQMAYILKRKSWKHIAL